MKWTQNGLVEVPNPSEMLLSGRPLHAPGTCVACVMEGSRPVMAEIQALVSADKLQRAAADDATALTSTGQICCLQCSEKRGGLNIGMCDGYINVIGGLQLDEPAADLALVLAVASSYRDKPMDSDVTAIGEVGLTGEVRSVLALQQRLAEAARIGFTNLPDSAAWDRQCADPGRPRGRAGAEYPGGD